MMDQFPPSYNQSQQQVVLPMEQEADVEALRQRDDQLRQLEVRLSDVHSSLLTLLLDEYRPSERIIQRRGHTRPRTRRNHRYVNHGSVQGVTSTDIRLDSIEQHVVDTESNVITGNRQLVKAVSYQVSLISRNLRLVGFARCSRVRHDGRKSFWLSSWSSSWLSLVLFSFSPWENDWRWTPHFSDIPQYLYLCICLFVRFFDMSTCWWFFFFSSQFWFLCTLEMKCNCFLSMPAIHTRQSFSC